MRACGTWPLCELPPPPPQASPPSFPSGPPSLRLSPCLHRSLEGLNQELEEVFVREQGEEELLRVSGGCRGLPRPRPAPAQGGHSCVQPGREVGRKARGLRGGGWQWRAPSEEGVAGRGGQGLAEDWVSSGGLGPESLQSGRPPHTNLSLGPFPPAPSPWRLKARLPVLSAPCLPCSALLLQGQCQGPSSRPHTCRARALPPSHGLPCGHGQLGNGHCARPAFNLGFTFWVILFPCHTHAQGLCLSLH